MNWSDILKVAVPAGAAVAGGVIAAKGATGAANTQAASADKALALQEQIFQQQQQNLQPYLTAGRLSLSQLLRGLGINAATAPVFNSSTGGQPNSGTTSQYSSPLLGNLKANVPGHTTIGRISTGAGLGAIIGGPLGAGVGAGVGAVTGLVGQGRRQADQLVPLQNQVGAEVDRITKAVAQAKANGTLTQQEQQTAINTVQALQNEFGQVAQGFDKAGQGGIDTLAKYFNPLVQGWQNQLASLPQAPAGDTAGSTTASGTGVDTVGNPIGFGQFTQPFDPTKDPAYNGDFLALNHPFTSADYTADPGYDFRLKEGQKALERSASAAGGVLGGANLKAITRYGQDFASNEFSNGYNRFNNERSYGAGQYNDAYNRFNNDQANQFNRLSVVAGLGQTANGQTNSAAANFGNEAGNLITGAGNATAAGQAGSAAAIGGALNSAGSNVSQYLTLQQILAAQANQGQSGYKLPAGSYYDGGVA